MRTGMWFAAAGAAAALAAGCSSGVSYGGGGGNSGGASSTSAAGAAVAASSSVAIAAHGGQLVGPGGHTLYFNTVDSTRKIICTGGCTELWPPVMGHPHVGAGLSAGKFSTVSRPGGGVQAVYAGHPLYEFSGDHAAGDKSGSGITDAGGTWIVAKVGASGAAAPSASSSSASSGGSSGGYGYP